MFSSSKPYTAVTVYIERLTGEEYEENDFSGIVDLVEAIQIQPTGPTEAARAIRKKLKYGNSHRQIRALTILDGLIQNAGGRFQRAFADEPLLERLKLLPRDETVDPAVRQKCNVLFRQWGAQYKSQQGLSAIASLYKDLPKKSLPTASQSRVIRENEHDLDNGNPFADADDEDDEPQSKSRSRKSSLTQGSSFASSSPSSRGPSFFSSRNSLSSSSPSTKKDKRAKRNPFSLEREKTNIMQAIAASSVASTNLLNALKLINREATRVSESQDVMNRFEACKLLRRQILRYIQLVESDQWIGSLLSANDELVKALMAFEVMDKSVDNDSDSEAEMAGLNDASSSSATHHARKPSRVEEDLAGLSFAEKPPAKPPRPGQSAPLSTRPQPVPPSSAQRHPISEDEADDNDPFGDQHEIGA